MASLKLEVAQLRHQVELHLQNEILKNQIALQAIDLRKQALLAFKDNPTVVLEIFRSPITIVQGGAPAAVTSTSPAANGTAGVETEDVPRCETRLVAMLNNDKTAVLNVFSRQKDAAAAVNKSISYVNRAVNKGMVIDGNHFTLWPNVANTLRHAYLADHELPDD